MDKQTALATPPLTPTDEDEATIMTSSELDNGEAWTLINDSQQKKKRVEGEQKKAPMMATDRNGNNNSTAEEEEEAPHSRCEELPGNKEGPKGGEEEQDGEGNAEDEEEENEDDDEERHFKTHETRHDHDSSVDELSDGISIISETDSLDRFSPHPYLPQNPIDLHLKFIGDALLPPLSTFVPPSLPHEMGRDCLDLPLPPPPPQASETTTTTTGRANIRQRRQQASSQAAAVTGEEKALQSTENDEIQAQTGLQRLLPPLVRRGLRVIFYIAVLLIALAFAGKWRHPNWGPGAGGILNTQPELEAKMSDMEMQNNLMRAEIDLLAKQVNYLSSVKEANGRGRGGGGGGGGFASKPAYQAAAPGTPPPLHDLRERRQANRVAGNGKGGGGGGGVGDTEKQGKQFKAWLGNGKSLEPVEITKQDLKRAYRCPNGQFVEVAGMCVDNEALVVEPLLDEAAQAVADLWQQSPLKPFDELSEKIEKMAQQAAALEDSLLQSAAASTATPPSAAHVIDRLTPAAAEDVHEQQPQQRGRWQKDTKQKEKKHKHDKMKLPPPAGEHQEEQLLPVEQQNLRKQVPRPEQADAVRPRHKGDAGAHETAEGSGERRRQYATRERYPPKERVEGGDHKQERHRRQASKERDGSGERRRQFASNSKEKQRQPPPKQEQQNSKERSQRRKTSNEGGGGGSGSQEKHRRQQQQQQQQQRHQFGQEPTAPPEQDSEWHERRMQQRENARRLSDEQRQRDGKNWYIKRGDGREKHRHERGGGQDESEESKEGSRR